MLLYSHNSNYKNMWRTFRTRHNILIPLKKTQEMSPARLFPYRHVAELKTKQASTYADDSISSSSSNPVYLRTSAW